MSFLSFFTFLLLNLLVASAREIPEAVKTTEITEVVLPTDIPSEEPTEDIAVVEIPAAVVPKPQAAAEMITSSDIQTEAGPPYNRSAEVASIKNCISQFSVESYLAYLLFGGPVLRKPTKTNFLAKGYVQCDRVNEKWCFIIILQEVDNGSPIHDKIDHSGVHCTHKNRYAYELKGTQEDDGLFNNFYEVAFEIRHTCTQDHAIRQIFTNYEQIETNLKQVNITRNFDITHRGVEIDSWRPNNF